MEAPNELTDPISFHWWWHANKCSECNGAGERFYTRADVIADWPELEHLIGELDIYHECQTCDGNGFAPGVFE